MDKENGLTKNLHKAKLYLTAIATAAAVVLFFIFSNPGRQDRLVGPEEKSPVPSQSPVKKRPDLPTAPSDGKGGETARIIAPASETGKEKADIPDYKRMKTLINEELKGFPGDASVIFYDPVHENSIKIKPKVVFESASLVKIPIMVDVFKKINEGEIAGDKLVKLKQSHKVGGSGVLKDKPSGSTYKVEKLVELMIAESDNTATDMLIELTGMKSVEKTARELGMKNTTLQRKIYDFDQIDRGKDNLTTPEDMLAIFLELYQGDKIDTKTRGRMLNILKMQKNKKMIPRFLPVGVECAHKTGGLLGIRHDCGIVYPPDGDPYILILMSKNVTDPAKAERKFALISKRIYYFLNGDK